MYKNPVKMTCPDCGTEFETRCCTRKLCKDCIKRHKAEYQKSYVKKWLEANPEKRAEYNRNYREKNLRVRMMPEKAYPAKIVPCMGGCGKMLETRNRNGRMMCPDCRIKSKIQRLAAYVETHGTTPQGKWQKENRESARKASARYYERHKEEIRIKRFIRLGLPVPVKETPPPSIIPPAVKPQKPKAAKKIKTKPKAEAPRLPSEAEKLAMLRAAMRRFYGD